MQPELFSSSPRADEPCAASAIGAGEMAALGEDAYRAIIEKHLSPRGGDPAVWEVLLCADLIDRTLESRHRESRG